MPIYPHPENRCAISHDKTEWLEVYLTKTCNAICEWCFDKDSYHPFKHVSPTDIVQRVISFPPKNIILTGGEPTLYKELETVINLLVENDRKVYMTTNGSKLTPNFIQKITRLSGITISIHHFDLDKNKQLTGIKLDKDILKKSINNLHKFNIDVRINCTVTKGYLEDIEDINNFINFGKELNVDSIRFAEISYYDDLFVDLNKIFEGKYELTDEPFLNGCYKSTKILGMPVDIKLSCGALTHHRKLPEGATLETYKNIIYYDGESYKGWQTEYQFFEEKTIDNILDNLIEKKITKEEAIKYLKS